VEQLVLVDPDVSLSVDLAKAIEVELTDQGLEAIVAEELRQRLRFQALDIRSDDKRIALFCPLLKGEEIRSA
jgi:hypothetical protein